jgi:L-methionine (R)-S-oxide reductase
MLDPLPFPSSEAARRERYEEVIGNIAGLLDGEDDPVAAMATVAAELHHAFAHFHWTGFYRVTAPQRLVIGPYQGGHGCLRIPFDQGVCGAAARTRQTQLVPDVHAFPGHIACASSTQSELVVPIVHADGHVLAVIDLDSDHPDAFDALDVQAIESIAATLAKQFPGPW